MLVLGGVLWYRSTSIGKAPFQPAPTPISTPVIFQAAPTSTPAPIASSTPKLKVLPTASVKETKKPEKPVQPMAVATPPPIELHRELIPKNIEIVRVYYGQQITGPGSIVEFDINGSGFNNEFEKMIT